MNNKNRKRELTPEEIRHWSIIAGQLFDTNKSEFDKLSAKEFFIKAFLIGREKTLDELGAFDADIEDLFEGIE